MSMSVWQGHPGSNKVLLARGCRTGHRTEGVSHVGAETGGGGGQEAFQFILSRVVGEEATVLGLRSSATLQTYKSV